MLTKLMPPPDLSIPAAGESDSLAAVRHLFEALRAQDVRYCHWKSNLRLERSLLGKTDLDLLVDRAQASLFRQILQEQGIKPFHAAPGRHYPAMENYLGFDHATGSLFHLHVHYQLVLGEQFVKNYRLPLEDNFLESTQLRHGVRIPPPELEIIVLSIRILLKYRAQELLRDLLPYRSTGISADFRKEIEWLAAQTDRERILQTLEQVAEVVPGELVVAFLDIAATGRKAGFKLLFLRNRLRRTLGLFQRTNPFSALVHSFVEMWKRRTVLRSSPLTKMTLPAGGLTLAVIGADGAGKSTLTRSLAQWLSWKLDAHVYYLGSKQPTARSRTLYLVYRMMRSAHRLAGGVLGKGIGKPVAGLRDFFLYWHNLSLGQDRYQRYVAGMKKSMGGSVVIFDRYPLESIHPQIGSGRMDGSRILSLAGERGGRLSQRMAGAEKALYNGIRPPDHLAILNVSPAVSLQRKPDHKQEVVEAKSQLVGRLAALAESGAKRLPTVQLDADRPFEEVFLELKRKVWEIL